MMCFRQCICCFFLVKKKNSVRRLLQSSHDIPWRFLKTIRKLVYISSHYFINSWSFHEHVWYAKNPDCWITKTRLKFTDLRWHHNWLSQRCCVIFCKFFYQKFNKLIVSRHRWAAYKIIPTFFCYFEKDQIGKKRKYHFNPVSILTFMGTP